MPTLRTDRLLVVDLEMTCWDGPPPPDQRPEIIEIGIAEIDVKALVVSRSDSFLVKPVSSDVSQFCEQLTGISSGDVKRAGRPLPEVLRSLAKVYGPARKAWMAWGDDRDSLERDCRRLGAEMPFSSCYINLAMAFSTLVGGVTRVGLSTAMEHVGIKPLGRAHSGVDDAINAARVWIEMARDTRALAISRKLV